MRGAAVFILAATLFAAPANDQAAPSGEAWLKLVDNGKYADSWREASSYFRSRITEAQWVEKVRGGRGPLGGAVSRKQQSIAFAKALPGVPDGNYAVMVLQTSFQNKASAVETLTMTAEGDKWRMAGYYIR